MSDTFKFLLGAMAGVTAGIVTGVLIAPASGKETRDKICDKTEELLESIKELVNKNVADAKKAEAGK